MGVAVCEHDDIWVWQYVGVSRNLQIHVWQWVCPENPQIHVCQSFLILETKIDEINYFCTRSASEGTELIG